MPCCRPRAGQDGWLGWGRVLGVPLLSQPHRVRAEGSSCLQEDLGARGLGRRRPCGRRVAASDASHAAPSPRSVEHDFRQQEGRFQRVLSHMEGEAAQSSPAAGPVPPARQEPSPVSRLPAKLDSKKSRRKCFWFL